MAETPRPGRCRPAAPPPPGRLRALGRARARRGCCGGLLRRPERVEQRQRRIAPRTNSRPRAVGTTTPTTGAAAPAARDPRRTASPGGREARSAESGATWTPGMPGAQSRRDAPEPDRRRDPGERWPPLGRVEHRLPTCGRGCEDAMLSGDRVDVALAASGAAPRPAGAARDSGPPRTVREGHAPIATVEFRADLGWRLHLELTGTSGDDRSRRRLALPAAAAEVVSAGPRRPANCLPAC